MTNYTLRPREKILSRTASALSDHELLQALIGTGTRQLSVSRIARSTLKELRKQEGAVSYEDLRSIPGLGHAYSARILAAFELARRWSYLRRPSIPSTPMRDDLRKQLEKASSVFAYDLYDGAGGFLERQIIILTDSIDQTIVMRQLLARALAAQAASIGVGISGDRKQRMLYTSDIVYCRSLKTMFESIGMYLRHFTVVSADETRELL